jgi:ABC-type glycerol-3-phosphate transport system permease component
MSVSTNQQSRLPDSRGSIFSLRWITRSRRNSARAEQLVILITLGIGALAMIIPFVWMVATSLSRSANFAMPRIPRLIPTDPSIFNYTVALANLPVETYYINSVVVTALTTIGYLFLSSLTGYVFAKGKFPGKTFFFFLLLTSLMIPFEIRMIPLYLLMQDLHLADSLAALILPFLAGGFGMFLMRQYITTIPDDLIDAARVDGANELLIYWRVILPLCGPALAALAILTALWRWNDVLWPLLVISDRKLYTITLGLAIASRTQGIYTGVALANAALTIIPIIIVYLLLQRYIIKGIMLGSIKG